MRIAKPALMFSLSVFLLAASWSLVTGQFSAVGPAHAQTMDPFVAVLNLANGSDEGPFHVVTESGEMWTYQTEGYGGDAVINQQYNGNIRGGAVPTTSESLGSVKGKYGGGGDN